MQDARGVFLLGARLSGEQHWIVPLGGAFDRREGGLPRTRAADENGFRPRSYEADAQLFRAPIALAAFRKPREQEGDSRFRNGPLH